MDLFVFTFRHDQNIYRALSPLSPEEVKDRGLPTEAVLGEINAALPSMTPDQFEQNDAFVDLVHEIIRSNVPFIPSFCAEAASIGRGELLIIDQRSDIDDMTTEDILGRFDLTGGELDASNYQPNEQYRVLTEKGPIQLDSELEEHLLTYLTKLPRPNAESKQPHEQEIDINH